MSRTPDGSRVSDYHYDLPDGRIARYPAERRDESRVLILPRHGGAVRHGHFHELPRLFRSGDLLVLNESRVRPVRLVGTKPTGARGEVLLIRPAPQGRWEALVRPGSKLKPGRVLEIATDLAVRIEDSTPEGGRIVALETPLDPDEALDRYGHVPLPPYLGREDEPVDRERYQTVYARVPGSVAAPTAGFHFTHDVLAELEKNGVGIARLVLHVGVGTFRPVEVEAAEDHVMHRESYEVPPEVAAAVAATRARDGRVWAVGTTVVRVLEATTDAEGRVRTGSGWTDLFLRPPIRIRSVDCLITNFHLPRSTLLMLVAAFAGFDRVMAAYEEAVRSGYRFYSYGDAMVIS